ncbi:BEL1-like homeodomain protein 11 [Syzygium oleosum]|uniref:BEL1-like homeodomain protein 11 n=1 Tax=Syzygium oleosum TaxID=219896 RepID=UPI0011D28BEB|nr:BEL1-like homeodomain protein 11 [Syzygium oleosum]XP_030459101.1 BEL1-like homeodomain protein 11 [Syzygium oleosum]XP_056162519.1 BEL1-like homeodomain protein 11 [Syzygium oleosum]
MVTHESPPNPMPTAWCRFIPCESRFEGPDLSSYGSGLRNNTTFFEPIGAVPSIQYLGERMPRSINLVHSPVTAAESHITHTRHLMDLLEAANVPNDQAHSLTLSLKSPLLEPNTVQFGHRPLSGADFYSSSYVVPGESREACDASNDSEFASSLAPRNRQCLTSYRPDLVPSNVGNSRYLKPAQSLLEEVVGICGSDSELANEKYLRKLYGGAGRKAALGLVSELKEELGNNGLSAEKHELQAKLAKLVSLLEEVEERFTKYYFHMEEVVLSFESVAGLGAAKSYTALALQAMTRHFCNSRDAIVSQIKITRRKLFDDSSRIISGLSRLSLFDRECRQKQRISLQQLGLIHSQRQAWRPIRGLPETSLVILRSWLFEHFLHPYPNDSEKLMLASQTGLTKNQVSNWFINARVRLWKPMIEEMYKEEFADSSEDSNLLIRGSITDEDSTNLEDE